MLEVALLKFAVPAIDKSEPGVVVPIPTFPVLRTVRSVVVAEAVDEPIAKSVVAVSPLLLWIESLAYGDEVPIPRAPDVGSVTTEEVAGSVP